MVCILFAYAVQFSSYACQKRRKKESKKEAEEEEEEEEEEGEEEEEEEERGTKLTFRVWFTRPC